MINTRAGLNLLAISAALRETAINVPQVASQSLLVSNDSYIQIEPRTVDNSDESTGLEEPDLIYNNGQATSLSLSFNKLQPNQAAILLAYGLGSCVTVPAGSGYLHTFRPIAGDLDVNRSNPSFSGVQRKGATIEYLRAASFFANKISFDFKADDWVKGSGDCAGTGYVDSTVSEVSISAGDNVTSLTLPVAIQGANSAERLDSIQNVRAYYNGGWRYLTPVSSSSSATVAIPSLGGAGATVQYRVLYNQVYPAWTTMPARILETPMRVSQMCLMVGGTFNGSSFVGGVSLGASLDSFSWSLDNKLSPAFTPCSGGAYAGKCLRDARSQGIKLSREMRSLVLDNFRRNNEYFGISVLCEGAEYATGHKYTLEGIFPRCAIVSNPAKTNKNRIYEEGDIAVLEDATYGSCIFRVKNLVSGYAA